MNELFFFYGTLCHPPLIEAVLGHVPELLAAQAEGHEVREALGPEGAGLAFPLLLKGAGAAPGALARISAEDRARLDFYETGYHTELLSVVDAAGARHMARVYLPEPGRWSAGGPWLLADWVAIWGEIAPLAAAEFMALRGQMPAEKALARYGSIKVRAASKLRASAQPRPATLRHAAQPGDVVVESLRTPYAHFFAVEDYRLRHRLLRGGESAPLERAAFVSGDATVVLPYDPARDRVLLVEQFRTGPFARGDLNPWSLETIAGRIDPTETPQEAARREAEEEAGVRLGRLVAAPNHYPSPGAKSEFIYCYIGLCDLPELGSGHGGLEEEGEDIRAHVIPFAQLMALIDSGEIENGPLIMIALWLDRMREGLRAEAAS